MNVIILSKITPEAIEHALIGQLRDGGDAPVQLHPSIWRIQHPLSDALKDSFKRWLVFTGNAPEYLLGSRLFKKTDSQFELNGLTIGGQTPVIIAGPCSAESYDQLARSAEGIVDAGTSFFRAGLYKPRTSPYAFQGLRSEGVELLRRVRETFNLTVVTEVMGSDHLDEIAAVSDVLQIGSRNMHNYSLLEEVAVAGKPVLLKRGMSAGIEEFLMAAEYILAKGNDQIILCERGIKTYETATRNTLDLNAVPFIRQHSHLPVFVDPSHGTGVRTLVEPMALAALACGAQGLEIEVHPEPDKALSDGHQSLSIPQFKQLMEKVSRLSDSMAELAHKQTCM